jgi:hypothetical protein
LVIAGALVAERPGLEQIIAEQTARRLHAGKIERRGSGRDHALDSICIRVHTSEVPWVVELGEEFEPEFFALQQDVREEILALARLLQQFGPQLGRPRVDTLKAPVTRI